MSKAEDLAERAYPKREYVIYGPLPSEEPSVIDDNKPYRIGFVEGYHQAEKDNELSWEDINTIIGLYNDLDDKTLCNPKRACKEILKQFKERKDK